MNNKDITCNFIKPKYAWRCQIAGDDTDGTYFSYVEGLQPNWFHRLMQRIILGFKWEKIND